jgi:hypothetical protein
MSLNLHGQRQRDVDRWYAGGFSRQPDFQSKRNLPALAGSGSATNIDSGIGIRRYDDTIGEVASGSSACAGDSRS